MVRGLVVHPWRSVDGWTRNVLGEGDGVGNLCSEGVGVEDAMAPIMFSGCTEIPAFLTTVFPGVSYGWFGVDEDFGTDWAQRMCIVGKRRTIKVMIGGDGGMLIRLAEEVQR